MNAENKVLKKIKKCLALAKSCNPNEAAAAMRQAKKLMEMHSVTETELELSRVTEFVAEAPNKSTPAWTSSLIASIAKAFECKAVLSRTRGRTEIKFIGFDHGPEVAAFTLDILVRALVKARKNFLASYSRLSPPEKRQKGKVFSEGWVVGIGAEVSRFSKSLTPAEEDLIDTCVQRDANGWDSTAEAGFEQGSKVKLHAGVKSDGSPIGLGQEA